MRAYGTEADAVLGDATQKSDLGRDFGATLTEAEIRWLMNVNTRAAPKTWSGGATSWACD